MARQCVKSLTCLTSTTYGIDTIIIPISQTWKLRHKDELTCQVPMTGWWNQVYDCWCNSHRAMPFVSRELASPRIKITEPRDNCDLLLSHSFYRRRKAETHPGSPRAGPRNQVSFFLSECWSYCVLLYRGPSAAEGLLKKCGREGTGSSCENVPVPGRGQSCSVTFVGLEQSVWPPLASSKLKKY